MAIMTCMQVQPSKEMTADEFKVWLRRYDANHDGRVSVSELREALHSLRVWFSSWQARRGLKEADSDHDGLIDSPEEIEKLVDYAQHHLHMKITRSNW